MRHTTAAAIFVGALAAFLSALLAWIYGFKEGILTEQKAAAKAGVAEYVAGENGEPQFRYKTPKP